MHIVCFGDSITFGFPYGPEKSWINYVRQELPIGLVNAGENGNTVDDLLRRVDRDVLLQEPKYTFVMIGTNDAAIGLSAEKYMAATETLVSRLQTAKIQPLFGLPIPSHDLWLEKRLVLYRQSLKEFTESANIPCLDFAPGMYDLFGKLNSANYLDEVHPSSMGYAVMGRLAVPFFKRLCNVE